MIAFSSVPSGSTLYIPFCSYGKTNGESITMSGFATSDILIYKNGSTTQRSSTAGFTLLDTDGIDFDGVTGLHGFSIDLSDNTDSGFYAVGSQYWVVVSTITVDSQTVTFLAATFRIVAAEATAGYPVVTHKVGTGTGEINLSSGKVPATLANSDVTGNVAADVQTIKTQTVTCSGGVTVPAATLASTTNITAASGVTISGTLTTIDSLWTKNKNWLGALAGKTTDSGTLTEIQATTAGASYDNTTDSLQAIKDSGGGGPTASDIADAVWDEALAGHASGGSAGAALTAAGSAGDPWSTALPGAYGSGTAGKILGDNLNATVSSRASQTSVDTVDDFLDTEIAAIKAKTDNLPASPASTTNITAGTITTVTTLTNDPQSIRANTAQAGGSTTITLDASASATNDLYVGNEIVIAGGTGAGQTRRITDYVGSTKVATVDSAWVTNPDNTSTFKILPLAAVDVDTAAIASDVSSSIGTSGITITSPLINGVVTLYANRDYTTGTGRLEITKPDDVDWPTSLGSGGYETIEFHAKIGVPGAQTTDKVGTGSVVTPTAPNQEVAFVFTREAINTLNESFLDAIDGTPLIASLAIAKQNGGELSSSVAAQLEQRSSYTVMAFTSPGCEGTILAQGPLNIVDAGFDSSGSTCPLTP